MQTILKLVMVAKRIKKMMNWPMIEMRNKTILKDVITVCEIFVEEVHEVKVTNTKALANNVDFQFHLELVLGQGD